MSEVQRHKAHSSAAADAAAPGDGDAAELSTAVPSPGGPSTAGPSTAEPSAVLVALFELLQEHFFDEAAHQRFLEACTTHQGLAYAARQYRAVQQQAHAQGDEQRASLAAAQLQKITGLAFAMLETARPPRKDYRRLMTYVAISLTLLVVLLSALVLSR